MGKKLLKKYRKKAGKRMQRRMKKYGKASLLKTPNEIVSDRFITKIKYNRIQDISCPNGLINNYTFRGNDVYDPDYSGTGGWTAIGLSQMAALYTRYRVYASKITIQPLAIGGGLSSTSFYICLIPQLDFASTGDFNDAVMNPYSKFRNFNANNTFTGNIKHYMTTEKIFGLNDKTVEIDDTYSALTNTTPGRPWYWQLYVVSPNATQGNNVLNVMITIEYFVEFFGRKANLFT